MAGVAADFQELQRRVQLMQGSVVPRTLPSLPGLSGLIRLRTGATYGVNSAALALALLAGPSQAGEWVGVVGAADLGCESRLGWWMWPQSSWLGHRFRLASTRRSGSNPGCVRRMPR